jgi:uncharacterized protein (DUF302 family)
MAYYFSKIIKASFDAAVDRVTESLKKEGFGILTDIDVQATLKAKLGVDFQKYRILGACSPAHAFEALKKENKIGTMLPCNVVVQEIRAGEVEIAAIDPVASMQAVENPALVSVAQAIQQKLKNVVANA